MHTAKSLVFNFVALAMLAALCWKSKAFGSGALDILLGLLACLAVLLAAVLLKALGPGAVRDAGVDKH